GEIEEDREREEEDRTRACRLIPHLLLCLSLVAYAALGGFVFELIEGPVLVNDHKLSAHVLNVCGSCLSVNVSYSHDDIVSVVEGKMRAGFQSTWLQRPERYGEIYPVTLTGKVVCVLYAMVGIPLMLLVILDVGDFMALLMSRTYVRLHSLCKAIRSRARSPWKPRTCADSLPRPLEDEYLFFQSRRCQFTEKEPTAQKPVLPRTGPPAQSTQGFAMWDFSGLGDGMETLDVPFVLILFIVFAYILLGGLILPIWETEFKGFDPYYFCFITLTTIGLVKSYPVTPNTFMLTSLFIIIGMAIMSMAFKLSQSRIVSFYQCACAKCFCPMSQKEKTFNTEWKYFPDKP
uniref:Potassium channel, subfamily K, member 18 n=1 Tax=Sphaeramia orbicularis TaxID=375764 RepID=A0A673BAD8_9TELE